MKLTTYFLSCPNETEGIRLSKAILEQKLAVCVKRVATNTMYHWDNQIKRGNEVLLIIESVEEKFDELVSTLNKIHSDPYYVLTALSISKTTPGVIEWIKGIVG